MTQSDRQRAIHTLLEAIRLERLNSSQIGLADAESKAILQKIDSYYAEIDALRLVAVAESACPLVSTVDLVSASTTP